ncbi:MAG: GIY-YIG nuclease family protein [Chloroflexota bacterium]
MKRQYYVYIVTNGWNRVLYTGVTNDLERRVCEHKNKVAEGFTKRYNAAKLVFYEIGEDVESAIAREKQLKGWLRKKKVALIESMNPEWRDLSLDWVDSHSEKAQQQSVILKERSD